MFGGVTILDEDLNLNIYKELLMLFGGPVCQILFYLLIFNLYTEGYVGSLTYEKVAIINKILLSFNLLPILPLDGGKIINNILDLILPYKLSHKIAIIISIITLPVLLYKIKVLNIMLFLILLIKIYNEISLNKYKLNKLLLERKLKNYKFKKTKKINNIKEVKRNENFIYKEKN